MSKWSKTAHGGTHMGLAMLFCAATMADDTLRERIHREYKHQSYMLIEDAEGAHLFLFGTGEEPVDLQFVMDHSDSIVGAAIEKTRSTDPRARVRGLTELAGHDDPAALDTALALLSDPDTAVRDEAAHLILDHPNGGDVAVALGLVDEDDADE